MKGCVRNMDRTKLEALLKKKLRVTMPDGSRYDVSVELIARNRAAEYVDEYDGNIETSLWEDTLPCFADNEFEIEDWAVNNMNWKDVVRHAWKVQEADRVDYEDGWINGEKEIING
jgi:hypothetical protein